MIGLLVWALLHQPKLLKAYLHILRGAAEIGREERLAIVLANYTQGELRHIDESLASQRRGL